MQPTLVRIEALLDQAPALEPWVGQYTRQDLLEWLRLELGSPVALDEWKPHGGIHSRATPLSPLLHIVSGNTPHAAFQSVFRGLMVGARNRIKLPSAGLEPFENWVGDLPGELSSLIELKRDLPEEWLACGAAVVFGGAETIATFRRLLPPGIPLIEHGPKLSIGVVFETGADAASKLAEDILGFNQRGCLSLQAIYVDAPEEQIRSFGNELAIELDRHRRKNPRPLPSLSDSGVISNTRETARFKAANGDGTGLWESLGTTEWTIVYERNPKLAPSPLNGCVFLHPLPASPCETSLGPESRFLSTVAIHPFSPAHAARLEKLSPPRICAVGESQSPTIFWHHDGHPPLASLVRWRDVG